MDRTICKRCVKSTAYTGERLKTKPGDARQAELLAALLFFFLPSIQLVVGVACGEATHYQQDCDNNISAAARSTSGASFGLA